MMMINALKDATTAVGGPGRNRIIETYPCNMTSQEYYMSLKSPWDFKPQRTGTVKELHKVCFTEQEKFAGDRLAFAAWRRRFFAMVHTQNMLVADKAVALSAALDLKQENLKNIVRGLNYDARTYTIIIREL
jgi:hypothetical protein